MIESRMMGNYHVRFGATVWKKPTCSNAGNGRSGPIRPEGMKDLYLQGFLPCVSKLCRMRI